MGHVELNPVVNQTGTQSTGADLNSDKKKRIIRQAEDKSGKMKAHTGPVFIYTLASLTQLKVLNCDLCIIHCVY